MKMFRQEGNVAYGISMNSHLERNVAYGISTNTHARSTSSGDRDVDDVDNDHVYDCA